MLQALLTTPNAILAPVLALIAWTLLMLVWLYATRIPAMSAAGMKPSPEADLSTLPGWARRPAANYNHLHEQPTLFYALAVACHLAGAADPLNVALAWAYVAARVAHSLAQVLTGVILLRFAVFNVSAIILAVLLARTALALFG